MKQNPLHINKETSDQFVDDVYAPETDNCRVANLGNSPAIPCGLRLAFVGFGHGWPYFARAHGCAKRFRHLAVHPELIRGF